MLLARGLELTDVADEEAFAERVSLLAADAQRRERAALAGQQLFLAEFSWYRIAHRFLRGLDRNEFGTAR
jgi:glycosyltransferase involved in cell wall biosynthesis